MGEDGGAQTPACDSSQHAIAMAVRALIGAHLEVVLHKPGEVHARDQVVQCEEAGGDGRGWRDGEPEQAERLERRAAEDTAAADGDGCDAGSLEHLLDGS